MRTTKKGKDKTTWNLGVPQRFDVLTQKAAEAGCYVTKAEFIRAAVQEFLATFGEDQIDASSDDVEWTIKITPLLDELATKLYKTAGFKTKSEMIRYAVRAKIKKLLKGVKL